MKRLSDIRPVTGIIQSFSKRSIASFVSGRSPAQADGTIAKPRQRLLERQDAERLAVAFQRRIDRAGDVAPDLALHRHASDLLQEIVAGFERILSGLALLEIADCLFRARPRNTVDRAVVIAATESSR